MKKYRNILSIILVLIIPITIYAVPEKPPGENNNSSNVSYTSNTIISSNITEENKTYLSEIGSQNALLVSGGESTLTSCTITKSGDASGDNADFYGTNAAILVYNGASLNIKGGNITTNGGHANAVFSYGTGIINISDTSINTTSNNSGGVMVTGGGKLNANNLTVKTLGNSSAAIRSDRGGGELNVIGGTYETNGVGSPVIYSTANITVNNSTLTSTSSEGVVVEGANSVSLDNVKLTDTNNTLNGNSETYKNIFIYQSMSGDASEGTASFKSKDSTIVTNKGDTIFVTNTTAVISLENNTISNSDGDFLRIQTGKWGNSGSNGGNVTLNLTNQKIEGNILVDEISTLNLSLNSGSVFMGTINNENKAKNIDLKLNSDSVISLENDSYINSLDNEENDNSNIYLNGHKLYVNNEEVSANEGTYNPSIDKTLDDVTVTSTSVAKPNIYFYVTLGIFLLILICLIILILKKKRKNKEN